MAKLKRTARKSFSQPPKETGENVRGGDDVEDSMPPPRGNKRKPKQQSGSSGQRQRRSSNFDTDNNNDKNRTARSKNKSGLVGGNVKRRKTHDGSLEASSSQTSFQKKTVGKVAHSRWKQVQKPTRKYVTMLLDRSFDQVLGETSPDDQREVEEMLHKLKQSLITALDQMKVPSSQVKDYTKVSSQMAALKKMLAHTLERTEKLDSAIEEETQVCEKFRKKLHKLQNTGEDQNSQQTQDQPLPEEGCPMLDYPDYDSIEML